MREEGADDVHGREAFGLHLLSAFFLTAPRNSFPSKTIPNSRITIYLKVLKALSDAYSALLIKISINREILTADSRIDRTVRLETLILGYLLLRDSIWETRSKGRGLREVAITWWPF